MPDEQIPGTLNAGQALPTMTQALIFIATVNVDSITLVSMILAAVLGAWLGVGFIARLSRRAIQLGMGAALLCAALLYLASNVHWMPGGGEALGLRDGRLIVAISANALLGALMMLGVGLYAPCLILVSLLGMSPIAAFPIMMGSCGLLMPIGGARFVRSGRYNLGAALGLALGGIPAVTGAGTSCGWGSSNRGPAVFSLRALTHRLSDIAESGSRQSDGEIRAAALDQLPAAHHPTRKFLNPTLDLFDPTAKLICIHGDLLASKHQVCWIAHQCRGISAIANISPTALTADGGGALNGGPAQSSGEQSTERLDRRLRVMVRANARARLLRKILEISPRVDAHDVSKKM